MNTTPTQFLNGAISFVITFIVGFFMVITLAVMAFFVTDGISKYSKYLSKDVVATGYLHKYVGPDRSNPNEVGYHYCVGVQAKNKLEVKEYIPKYSNDFCEQLMNTSYVSNWQQYAQRFGGYGFTETTFWSILFLVVFGAAAFLWARLASTIVALIVSPLAKFVHYLTCFLLIPVLAFWFLMIQESWNQPPSIWKTPDGYTIDVRKVFITRDNHMYAAPHSLFSWSDNDTMMDVSEGTK